ncbi:ral guanine nucleotide dissociation stimulator-like isoform X3 [Equus przewalskii]|uniref:Ral guanine nucleotide dissociation stimulator-like isoform X3 n=1 Tax=Equus przewalskii TaxID=9798 RepID=A0ABM4NDF5_EQUPR
MFPATELSIRLKPRLLKTHLLRSYRNGGPGRALKNFTKLCTKDQRVSRKLLMEEATSLWETLEMDPWIAQERQQWQKFKVIKRIQLLQEAANECHLQPEEHFGACFQAMEPLREEESYSLSCQLEPPNLKVSKMRGFFRNKKNQPSSRLGLTAMPLARSHHTLDATTSSASSGAGTWLGPWWCTRPALPTRM